MPILAAIPLLIPIIALLIPIVAILSRHQLNMAEIMSRQSDPTPELQALRSEVAELRARLNEQALTIDNLQNSTRRITQAVPTVSDRA